MFRFRSASLLLALAVLTGCPAATAPTVPGSSTPATGASSAPGSAGDFYGRADAANPLPPVAPGASTAPGASSAPGAGPTGGNQVVQAPLQAGAVDDNASFAAYLAYRAGYQGQAMRQLDVSERAILRVVDADGKRVANADVTVTVGETVVYRGKSYANGELLFHPKAYPDAVQAQSFAVTAVHGDNTSSTTFTRGQEGIWELKLPEVETVGAAKLDVMLLIDTTGSMGGEIAKFQQTAEAINQRVRALPGQPAVRFGLVAYKDRGDGYVTQMTNFSDDPGIFQLALSQLSASGGGDYPEDMDAGLDDAIAKANWSTDDTVRLTFVVADAPPQMRYEDGTPYTDSMKRAVAKGIKLYPIGASGLAPEGEYVLRQLAQFTLGQYLFVTRGGDAATGGGATSATVDKFKEGRLDDIVVDIIRAELASVGQVPTPSASPSPSPSPAASVSPSPSPSPTATP